MKKIFVFAGLLAAPNPTAFFAAQSQQMTPSDSRFYRLKAFFESRHCPVSRFAADFLKAADANHLDWRLLPSISFVESTGGKQARNNNIFGWDSSRAHFSSVRAGIHAVASRLANSPLYRGKPLDEILATYNPNPEYKTKVKSVMKTLGSVKPLPNAGIN